MMKYLLLLSILKLSSSALAEATTCVAGTTWQEQCNSCFCTVDGYPACTFKECSVTPEDGGLGSQRPFSDFYRQLESPPAEPLEERSASCRQNDTWTEQCNQCACIADGTAVCTRMACKEGGGVEEAAARIGRYCEPGDTWSSGCTSCHCLRLGQVVCRHAHCPRARLLRATCVTGAVRRVGCNTCVCLSDGSEACSKRLCPAQVSAGVTAHTGCTRRCPADCGSRRLANGCLFCECGTNPFFSSTQLLPLEKKPVAKHEKKHGATQEHYVKKD